MIDWTARIWLLACVALLTGCASSVSLSLLGGGASAMVSHNLNGNVDRTFTLPLPTVREAVFSALETMGISASPVDGDADGGAIRATAADRSIEIEFERLGDNLTAVRATARKPGFLRDNATAAEVINQTERAMAALTGELPPVARQAATALRSPQPFLYIVNLDNIPAQGGRRMSPLPSRLQDYVLYTTESQRDGAKTMHVNLGYFSSEAEADAARSAAAATFPQATVVRFMREPHPARDLLPEGILRTVERQTPRREAVYF